jgi:PDZ domain-containing protein
MTTSVPADEGPAAASRRHFWGWFSAAAAVVVVGGIIGAATIQVPYYAIAPGGTLEVNQLVKVGSGAPYYRPHGSVFMCTVSFKETSILEALQGWLDPNIDVVPVDEYKPKSVSQKQEQQRNLQAMDTSKEQALGVAFEELGYDAISGKGAIIDEIVKGSPADGTLVAGDTIVGVDGMPVALDADAVRLLRAHRPGDTVKLAVDPKGGGAIRDVTVTLAADPKKLERPRLGVSLRTREPSFHFPYDVNIDSEGIGGPSAGLAFTLEVLDQLTPGELTGGHKVAATGTIELDGSVGPVGGVVQKTVAVRRTGAELFLVPVDELADARAHAGKHLRVEAVATLDDALRILAGLGGNGLALGHPGRTGA